MYNTNYILITNSSLKKIESAIYELGESIYDIEYSQGIHLKQHKNGTTFQICFSEDSDFENFSYFVDTFYNSLISKNKTRVRGYWTLKKGDKVFPSLYGQRIMLFNSDKEDEIDIFGATSGNKYLKIAYSTDEELVFVDTVEEMFNEPELDSSEFAWYKEIKPPVDSFLAAYENNPKGLYYEDIVNFFKHALPFIVGIYILSLNYFAGTLNFNIVRHLVIFIVTIVLALFCFIYGYIRYQKNKDNY